MTSSVKLKEAIAIESKHGAFYTGGNIVWLETIVYCQTNSSINLLDVDTGLITTTIGDAESEEADFIQTFTTDGTRVISAHKSGLLKLWNSKGELEKMWKYIHKGPIAKLSLKGGILASGGSDGIVRIWNLELQACLLSLKGCQGVVNVVAFPELENVVLASGDDGDILSYELEKGGVKRIYKGHYSKVTAITFSHNNNYFISSGRDKVIILWEFDKSSPIKTIATYETIEAMVGLPKKFKLPDFKSDPELTYVATAGERGIIRVWDVTNSKEIFVQTNSLVAKSSEDGVPAVTNLLYNPKSKCLAVVSSDHCIIVHHLKSFACLKQLVGFIDEVLDAVYVGKERSHIAIATNSNDIKLFESSSMNCLLLKAHTDLVLALSVSDRDPDFMLSSGKDNTIRMWRFNAGDMVCVGLGKRHTQSVSSVCFAQTSLKFAVSAGQDTCLKIWHLPDKWEQVADLTCAYTEIAHQKDINSVAVAPNDKLIASASQDKTVKLWSDSLQLVGVLKGHRRGVWCVRFSPVDQVVLSSSADCTVRLWSVADLTCLKTLEGHESSVLRAEFLSKGSQIISAGADGLIKIFNVKNSCCQCTKDEHDGKIWALAVKKDESEIITGGSDSLLIKWKDVTEEEKIKKQKQAEELILQEQKLSNYLHDNLLLKALKLSLKLNRPMQTLKIIESVIRTKDIGLADTIRSLRNDQKESLLKCASDWNANSRSCQPAQVVTNILLRELQSGDFRPVQLAPQVEQILPYTEKHFKRLTQLMQDMYFLNYTINCMKPHMRDIPDR